MNHDPSTDQLEHLPMEQTTIPEAVPDLSGPEQLPEIPDHVLHGASEKPSEVVADGPVAAQEHKRNGKGWLVKVTALGTMLLATCGAGQKADSVITPSAPKGTVAEVVIDTAPNTTIVQTTTSEAVATTTVAVPETTTTVVDAIKEPPTVERVPNKQFATLSFLSPNSPLNGVSYNIATETPDNDAGPELEQGVGWEWNYGRAVQPGEEGLAVIFGHRTTHDKPFLNIDTLDDTNDSYMTVTYPPKEGETEDATYWFKVLPHPEGQDNRVVDESDVASIYTPKEILDNPKLRMILIYACEPKGSSTKRILVLGVMVPNPTQTAQG